MLLNCSNHPYKSWPDNQKKAAEKYGNVIDYAFPSVGAELSEEEIEKLASETADNILKLEPDCVLCQGEFTLAFTVIEKILSAGIEVIAACSERAVMEEREENDSRIRTSEFNFVRFRCYA